MSIDTEKPTKRDLILDAINHRDTGRIPYLIQFDRKMASKLALHYGVERIGGIVDSGIECINRYRIPDPDEKNRGTKEPAAAGGDKYQVACLGSLWRQAILTRGEENLRLDLTIRPNAVDELLDGIMTKLLANMQRCRAEMDVDCIGLDDDYGSTGQFQISSAIWQRHIVKRLQQLSDAVHDAGCHLAMRLKGAIGPYMDEIVGTGVDLLNPEQSGGVDFLWIKREYGKYITLWGGYGTQGTMMFSSTDHIRQEVNEVCDRLGAGSGFVLSPGRLIPGDVPV
ncbi:MAG: hypothetical protein JRH15_00700 [Deltaproteobacteria bacterium]|nr:hypothetical protein [Deltaproteobacteria bacterium]